MKFSFGCAISCFSVWSFLGFLGGLFGHNSILGYMRPIQTLFQADFKKNSNRDRNELNSTNCCTFAESSLKVPGLTGFDGMSGRAYKHVGSCGYLLKSMPIKK